MSKDVTLELADVEELKGLRLTPVEITFISNYLSPECDFDYNKAFRLTIGEDAFNKLTTQQFYHRARKMASKETVKTAIGRLLGTQIEKRKQELIPYLVEELMLASSYDPASIIDDDGDLKGGSLLNIPLKMRKAVVEGIEVKYWGKDADVKTRTVKLTSKSTARRQLIDIAKVLAGLEEQKAGNAFNVNVVTQNIEGMPTAEELLKMAIIPAEAEVIGGDDASKL